MWDKLSVQSDNLRDVGAREHNNFCERKNTYKISGNNSNISLGTLESMFSEIDKK